MRSMGIDGELRVAACGRQATLDHSLHGKKAAAREPGVAGRPMRSMGIDGELRVAACGRHATMHNSPGGKEAAGGRA
jgi:hypothetical protein